ncbi:hypothetical protein VP01_14378g1, partial [Puccinia sorghi]
LLNSITEKSNHIKVQLEELTREQVFSSVPNGESSIVLSSRGGIAATFVALGSQIRIISNLQSIGAKLGTKLKERIYKVLQSQQPAVNKHIVLCALIINFVSNFYAQKPLLKAF